MASAAGDPSEDLCANMLEGCAKLKALLLKLKENLRRDMAALRLQAAARGLLARRQARAALALPLSAAAAQQQLQGSVSVDQLACHEALVVANPAPARLCSRLRTALPQLPVRTPHGVSMNWFGRNVIIPTASAMASMQVVPCAAMLVDGCHASTCLWKGIYRPVCFPWEPGGVVAAFKSMLQLEDELLKKGGSNVMGVGPRMAQPGLV
jgi:hypothetical protein